MSHRPSILIVDDDPSHLKLYSWILQAQGFTTYTTLIGAHSPSFLDHPAVDLVVLDYTFRTGIKATDVAQLLRTRWPGVPIVVLSDMMWMPDDIASFANTFVRKGEPEQLVARIEEMIGFGKNADGASS